MSAPFARLAMRALPIVAAFVLAAAPAARAQGVAALRAGNVGGGGGSAAGAGLSLSGAIGQPAIGFTTDGTNGVCAGFWCNGGLAVVAVGPGPGGSGAPLLFAFGPAVPNPTGGETTFALALPRRSVVRLEAYSVAGRRLDTGLGGPMDPGRYTLHWNAAHTPAGVYFARLVVDGQVRARRQIVVVR
jgi:hypothetical protein